MMAEGSSYVEISKALGRSYSSVAKVGATLSRGEVVGLQMRSVEIPIRDTQAIVNTLTYGKRGDLNHCIPTAGPLQIPASPNTYSRYLYGYWIGDGTAKDATFTVGKEDISEFTK